MKVHHSKQDETLSPIRKVFIRLWKCLRSVVLMAVNIKVMNIRNVTAVLIYFAVTSSNLRQETALEVSEKH
jgi:hypothetical protein